MLLETLRQPPFFEEDKARSVFNLYKIAITVDSPSSNLRSKTIQASLFPGTSEPPRF